MKDHRHEREYQVEGGFPVRTRYYQGDHVLLIHSLTNHVSGGDWGSGYRYSYDWKLEIPVYDGNWQTAEAKAIRRYKQHVAWQKRQQEVKIELDEREKADKLYSLVIQVTREEDAIFRLQSAGFQAEACLQAEYYFLEFLLTNDDGEMVDTLARRFGFSLWEERQSDLFDDFIVWFINKGCRPEAENIIQKLLETDEAKTREVLPGIAIAVSSGELEFRCFFDFLEEKGLFSPDHHRQWAMKVVGNLLSAWINETEKGLLEVDDRQSYQYRNKTDAQKRALTLWQLMGEWCQKENLSWEEVLRLVHDYIEEYPRSPQTLEILQRAFRLEQEIVDHRIVEYMSENIDAGIFYLYKSYVPQALALAKKNPNEKLLEGWVPLSFEEKQEVARVLIQKMLEEEHYRWNIDAAMKWNKEFELHVPELDRLEEIINLTNNLPKESVPDTAVALRGRLSNYRASDVFVRVLRLLSERGPSPEIRLRADDLKTWLEYEIEKSFPSNGLVINLWEVFALAQIKDDVPVGAGAIKMIHQWLAKEPEAAKDFKVLSLASGLELAINNFLLPGHSRQAAVKAIEFKEGKKLF